MEKKMALNLCQITPNLPKAPDSVNADLMTAAEVRAAIQEGLADIQDGRVQDASTAFADFRTRHP